MKLLLLVLFGLVASLAVWSGYAVTKAAMSTPVPSGSFVSYTPTAVESVSPSHLDEPSASPSDSAFLTGTDARVAESTPKLYTPAPARKRVQSSAPASVYYQNCTAVRNAGRAPLYRGQPGYAAHLDRDGDGIACEK